MILYHCTAKNYILYIFVWMFVDDDDDLLGLCVLKFSNS